MPPATPPALHVIPNTPPAQEESQFQSNTTSFVMKDPELHVHYPLPESSRASREDIRSHLSSQRTHKLDATHPLSSTGHGQILTALAIGAPLIASVVSSCTSAITADLSAILGAEPRGRPPKASAVIALLWCAQLVSMGAALTAVAGLALQAGYHDAHVGVTKRIVRFLRQWKANRASSSREERRQRGHSPHIDNYRVPSPALSAVTNNHKEQHMQASFRAAVVSARLLGVSVALLSIAIALYLFLLYPIAVPITVLVVGLVTLLMATAPMLPILLPH